MQKLPDFVPAFSHHLKPLMRDSSQFTCMRFHPRIDGWIPLHSAVESQQFRFHRRSTFSFRDLWITWHPYLHLPSAKIARLQSRCSLKRVSLPANSMVIYNLDRL
jgi:hypothetical protein